MKLKDTSACLFAGLVLAACAGSGYQKTDKGVVVTLNQQQPTDVRKVRVEVMGEKLIHVSATPEKEFSQEKSLIIVPQLAQTPFTVAEQGDDVWVKTSQVGVRVSKSTGQVRFTDAAGKQVLAEEAGGRTFVPRETDGTLGYTVRQVFESAGDDEGYYGLGQHQADEDIPDKARGIRLLLVDGHAALQKHGNELLVPLHPYRIVMDQRRIVF